MYLDHFGLEEQPFSITPDTHFYFNYSSHQEALNVLLLALRSGEGFIKVTGEVGLGKTLLCRKLLNSLGDEFVTAYIPNPHLSPASMRVALADELEIPVAGVKMQDQLIRLITQKLVSLAREGKRVVLCLDEAQELPEQTLEAVRLLTNLETEKQKLLHVVMFGQPELEQRLNNPAIRQLKQRISFSYILEPLTLEAVGDYIGHRLRVAGYRGAPVFDDLAVEAIHKASGGTPRLVNILAHKAMLSAYGEGKTLVQRKHARQAVEDTEVTRPGRSSTWLQAAGITLAVIGGGALVWATVRYLAELSG